MRVRKALTDDAAAIAKVNIDTWRTAFGGIFPILISRPCHMQIGRRISSIYMPGR